MGLAPRTLKGQLTLLFVVLTLVPVLVLTAFATRQLLSAMSRWQNPRVQEALDGSVDMARYLMQRTKNDLRQRGQLLAADPVLGGPVEEIDLEAVRTRLATAYNLDFMQIYGPEGTVLLEVTRDPLLAPPDPLPGMRELAGSEDPFQESSDQNLVAYAGLAGAPGDAEWVLVTGVYLDSDFFLRRDSLTSAVTFYRSLPVVISNRQRVVLVFLALGMVFLGGLSVWIARRLATRVSQPVASLGAGMERVARGEDAVHVLPGGTEETERLIRTFNLMSTELSRSRRELARAERLSAWRDVARRVAHEIKNALTPITFAVSRLRKSVPLLPEDQQERVAASLSTVHEEAEGLKRLAASFSELARLPVPELVPLDLQDLVASTLDAFEGEDRVIERTLPGASITVEGDRSLLRQALTNVIKNAVEATQPGGRIRVGLDSEDAFARVTVEDSGEGWPDPDPERSLDPYVTTKETGTGLGLSLVQRTVLQHGGRLELENRAEGGARVTLFLPYRSSRKVPADADEDQQSQR